MRVKYPNTSSDFADESLTRHWHGLCTIAIAFACRTKKHLTMPQRAAERKAYHVKLGRHISDHRVDRVGPRLRRRRRSIDEHRVDTLRGIHRTVLDQPNSAAVPSADGIAPRRKIQTDLFKLKQASRQTAAFSAPTERSAVGAAFLVDRCVAKGLPGTQRMPGKRRTPARPSHVSNAAGLVCSSAQLCRDVTSSFGRSNRSGNVTFIDCCADNEPWCLQLPAETGLPLGTLRIIGSAAVYRTRTLESTRSSFKTVGDCPDFAEAAGAKWDCPPL